MKARPERPDTKTVTVRKVAPKPRVQKPEPVRYIRTGSLGVTGDLWRLVNSGCFTDAQVGHAAVLPREVFDRLALGCPEGWDAGFGRQVDGMTRWWSTFDPACLDCKRAARAMLNDRGVDDEQVRKVFALVGARWTWTTPEKRAARKMNDSGTALIDPEAPNMTTDMAVRRRAARRAAAIVADDLKFQSEQRYLSRRKHA